MIHFIRDDVTINSLQTRTDIVHGHGFNINSGICLVLEGTVNTPSGTVGKKAHTCHLHLPNSMYSNERYHVTSTQTLRGRNLQLLQSENSFYATIAAQADADSNKQSDSPKVRHATHSAKRLFVLVLLKVD